MTICGGEDNGRAKLTEADVIKIRTEPRSDADWGRTLGVTKEAVSAARRGLTWRHVDAPPDPTLKHGGAPAKLTDDLVREIRMSAKSNAAWAREIGCSTVAVWLARIRRTWKHVE
jgi:hypothetical protein